MGTAIKRIRITVKNKINYEYDDKEQQWRTRITMNDKNGNIK